MFPDDSPLRQLAGGEITTLKEADHGQEEDFRRYMGVHLGGYSDKPIPFPTVVKKLEGAEIRRHRVRGLRSSPEPNTKEKRAEIKAMLDEPVSGSPAWAAPFPSPITTTAKDYLDVVKGHLEMCAQMGIKKLRTETVDPPTGIPGGFDYETAFAKTGRSLARVRRALREERREVRVGFRARLPLQQAQRDRPHDLQGRPS